VGYLNHWTVGIVSFTLSFLNPFLHEVEPEIPFSDLVFLLGVVSIPIGVLFSFTIINISKSVSPGSPKTGVEGEIV